MHALPQFTIAVAYLHPDNRGRIELRSNDPGDAPRIKNELLGSDKTVRKLISRLRIALEVVKHAPLHDLIVRESASSADLDSNNHETCHEYLRDNTYRGDHPAGRCKMGPVGDPDTVLDPRLRVLGVSGLRVADTSNVDFTDRA